MKASESSNSAIDKNKDLNKIPAETPVPHADSKISSDSFRDALEYSALVSITNLDGEIIYCNTAFQETSQYTQEELLGKDHRILNSGIHPPEFWQGLWQCILRGLPWRNDVCNKAKDGSLYWVDTTVNPMRDQYGEIYQYMSVRYDISKRKAAEEQQNKLINDMEKYAYLTAHNLRRPLSSVMGLINLIEIDAIKDNEMPKVMEMLMAQCKELDFVTRVMIRTISRTIESQPKD